MLDSSTPGSYYPPRGRRWATGGFRDGMIMRRPGASISVDDIERMVRHPLNLYKSFYGPSWKVLAGDHCWRCGRGWLYSQIMRQGPARIMAMKLRASACITCHILLSIPACDTA